MKTLIAVPSTQNLTVGFVESLSQMRKPDNASAFFQVSAQTYDSRNALSMRAIQGKYDNVLWVEPDIVCSTDKSTDAMITLLDDIETYDVSMVSGLYVANSIPVFPMIFDQLDEPARDKNGNMVSRIRPYMNYPQDTTFDIAGCGFGFVMTTVDLLKKLWNKFGPPFNPYPWASDDLSFCYRVNQLGEQIMCDSSVRVGHIGTIVFNDTMLDRGGTKDEN